MARIDFNVENIEAIHVEAPEAVASERDWMSPYVWEEADGLCFFVRAVPKHVSDTGNTGAIFFGHSTDGINFKLDETPALAPGPGALDIGGCEDPTVVKWNDKFIVYYTGVDETRRSGQMLYASGRDRRKLAKHGVAYASSKTQGNTKEATITRTADNRWRLFYEYAHDDASLIGLALGDGVAGPWHEQPAPFHPRTERWDNWHLSTGPMLTSDPDLPVMFYNGATEDARWRIGWIAFNRDCTEVVDRCIEPMIVPPPPLERNATDIAFAASVVVLGDKAFLYYSLADKALFRGEIRRG